MNDAEPDWKRFRVSVMRFSETVTITKTRFGGAQPFHSGNVIKY
jgi:hypothetical protein